jgi:hypothetical protein
MSDSTRVADLRVSRLTIFFVRYVYPLVGAWALVQRRRKTVRRLTYLIAAATLVNTGFVIYSVLR